MALIPVSQWDVVPTKKIGGVEIRYARTPKHPYGSIGARRTVWWTPAFLSKVNACIYTLYALKPMTSIQLAGAWHDTVAMNKQNPKHGVCRHCQGRAIDIDAIRFEDRILVTQNYPWNRKLYIGVESTLRLTFGTVLTYEYNRPHRNHFHCDDGTRPAMRRSDFSGRRKSRVLYLQLACRYVHKIDPGPLDGKWGGKTTAAVANILSQIGWVGLRAGASPGPIMSAVEVALRDGGYQEFCRTTAYVGLGRLEKPISSRTVIQA